MKRYWQEAALVVLLAALGILAATLDPKFLEPKVQGDLIALVWELALLSVPMTLIILTGGIDLSVGAAMSLAAVGFGLSHEAHWPIATCVATAVVFGTAAGALNGFFVSKIKVHPLIVTLATMSAFFGLAEGLSHARPLSGFPPSFTDAFTGVLPIGLVCLIGLFAILFLALTPAGQALYAIGLNEKAARFSGIPVDRIKFWLYTFSGSAAGMAAVLYAARRNTVKADIGQGMELDVITAVVLGGTSIYGGRGGLVGTLLGVLLVHETRQFVSWHWERNELIQIVIGSLLILSVLLHTLLTNRRKRAK